MKVNSINSLNISATPIKPQSFKSTAVPYPEYRDAYINNSSKTKNVFAAISGKISNLFSSDVSNEAKNIKSQINEIFKNKDLNVQQLNAIV